MSLFLFRNVLQCLYFFSGMFKHFMFYKNMFLYFMLKYISQFFVYTNMFI